MSIYPCIRKVFLLFAILAFNTVKGQHYLFIEADGQQPFYVKIGPTMISSSASGFLIIPKITAPEMELIIGFPKNTHPEVSFYINGTDRDRGFQLKRMDDQVWSLFDRTSIEFIKGGAAAQVPVQLNIVKKEEGGFASLLSVATDDKSLSAPLAPKNNPDKPSMAKDINKPIKSNVSANAVLKDKASSTAKVKLPTITSATLLDSKSLKHLVYVEKSLSGKLDTIEVEIEKVNGIPQSAISVKKTDSTALITVRGISFPADSSTALGQTISTSSGKQPQSVEETATKGIEADGANGAGEKRPIDAPAQVSKPNPIVVCDRPFGDYKDIRSLQKKLLGLAAVEEQFNYAVKVFSQKCFNTKQALEIGWFFVDEKSRLKLFTLLKPLISDPVFFTELEGSFLKEENINAFRTLISGGN